MNIANEKWSTINDFPNYMISSESRIINKTTVKSISISYNKLHNHRQVRLWNNGKSRLLKLYRLKAIAFIPNPNNKREVNHKDGDRMNEDISNLEWVTPSENMKHSVRNGLASGQFKKGFDHQRLKINKEDIILIKRLHKFLRNKEIAKIFSITPDHVSKIANGRCGNYV